MKHLLPFHPFGRTPYKPQRIERGQLALLSFYFDLIEGYSRDYLILRNHDDGRVSVGHLFKEIFEENPLLPGAGNHVAGTQPHWWRPETTYLNLARGSSLRFDIVGGVMNVTHITQDRAPDPLLNQRVVTGFDFDVQRI